MDELEHLRNIGPVSGAWLRAAGISGRKDLQRLGAVEVFCRVRRLGLAPSLNLLWALEGAVQDKPFQAVSPRRKQELRDALAGHMEAGPIRNKNKSQNRK